MPDLRAQWSGPYHVRIKRQVGVIPEGSVGTVVEHYADGQAAEVEFCVRDVYYVETVGWENMDDA